MLGASPAVTNRLQMACALRAERRWMMTGTPTPNTEGTHVSHLQPLLAALGQQPYGLSRPAWDAAIQTPFESGRPSGAGQSSRHTRIAQ